MRDDKEKVRWFWISFLAPFVLFFSILIAAHLEFSNEKIGYLLVRVIVVSIAMRFVGDLKSGEIGVGTILWCFGYGGFAMLIGYFAF
jgi:hypothetical protein